MYNVILFSDTPSAGWFSRGYGAYRLASELRRAGYTTLVVDFSSALSNELFEEIIDNAVGDSTLMVGFSVTWFPYRHKNLPNARFIVGPRSLNPDTDIDSSSHEWHRNSLAFGFSGLGINRYVDYIKARNPKTKVICGGAKSYEYVQEPKLDNVFIGYSENQLMDYINALSKKGSRRIFNKIVNYDIKAEIGDFDFNSCITSYEDIDCLMPDEVLTFEFSRGCIFNCAFCSYPHRNQDTRGFVKYKEVIYNELIDNWNKWGVYKYVITDDTFNDYTEKLILINEVIQMLPFKPEFWAYIRLDLISRNPEQAPLIKSIGVKEVYYGLETWHDDTAKIIKKGGSRNKKIEGMKIAKECWGDEVYIMVGTVIGLPHDTAESFREATDWYIAEGHNYINLFTHSPFALREFGENQEYIFQSDIEKDMKKYGYTFPDSKNNPLYWERSGPGNINNKNIANELMIELNGKMAPFWTPYRAFWNFDRLYDNLTTDDRTQTNLFYEYVTQSYFTLLMNKIRSKSNCVL
jgi:radical SAM superfamily enzyme YgiQ (UPF0313 family)